MIGLFAERRRRPFAQAIACFLVAVLFYGIVAPPLAEASIWDERKKSLEEMQSRKMKTERPWEAPRVPELEAGAPAFKAAGLEVPKELGQVVDSYAGALSADETLSVIHIQDAHGYVTSQKNVARLIRHFRESDPESFGAETPILVLAEGAWGRVDTDWLNVFPDKQILKGFADGLLARGEITGEEWLSVREGPAFIEVRGIEDETIYWDNVAARDRVESVRGEILDGPASGANVRTALSALDRLGRAKFPARLLEMESRREAFARNDLAVGPYVLYLKSLTGPSEWERNAAPGLKAFADVAAMEAALDWKKISAERDGLITLLQEKLDRSSLARLADDSLKFRVGKMSPREYHERLVRLAEVQNHPAPQIREYVAYLSKSAEIDPNRVREDLDRIEAAAENVLTAGQPPIIRKILDAEKWVRLSQELWNLKMSPDAWKGYLARSESMSWKAAGNVMSESGAGVPWKAADWKRFESLAQAHQDEARDYYDLAHRRDRILAEKSVAIARERGAKKLILVAGGFHTAGVTRALRGEKIAYDVVRPELGDLQFVKKDETLSRKILDAGTLRSSSGLMNLAASVPGWIAGLAAAARVRAGGAKSEQILAEYRAELEKLAASDSAPAAAALSVLGRELRWMPATLERNGLRYAVGTLALKGASVALLLVYDAAGNAVRSVTDGDEIRRILTNGGAFNLAEPVSAEAFASARGVPLDQTGRELSALNVSVSLANGRASFRAMTPRWESEEHLLDVPADAQEVSAAKPADAAPAVSEPRPAQRVNAGATMGWLRMLYPGMSLRDYGLKKAWWLENRIAVAAGVSLVGLPAFWLTRNVEFSLTIGYLAAWPLFYLGHLFNPQLESVVSSGRRTFRHTTAGRSNLGPAAALAALNMSLAFALFVAVPMIVPSIVSFLAFPVALILSWRLSFDTHRWLNRRAFATTSDIQYSRNAAGPVLTRILTALVGLAFLASAFIPFREAAVDRYPSPSLSDEQIAAVSVSLPEGRRVVRADPSNEKLPEIIYSSLLERYLTSERHKPRILTNADNRAAVREAAAYYDLPARLGFTVLSTELFNQDWIDQFGDPLIVEFLGHGTVGIAQINTETARGLLVNDPNLVRALSDPAQPEDLRRLVEGKDWRTASSDDLEHLLNNDRASIWIMTSYLRAISVTVGADFSTEPDPFAVGRIYSTYQGVNPLGDEGRVAAVRDVFMRLMKEYDASPDRDQFMERLSGHPILKGSGLNGDEKLYVMRAMNGVTGYFDPSIEDVFNDSPIALDGSSDKLIFLSVSDHSGKTFTVVAPMVAANVNNPVPSPTATPSPTPSPRPEPTPAPTQTPAPRSGGYAVNGWITGYNPYLGGMNLSADSQARINRGEAPLTASGLPFQPAVIITLHDDGTRSYEFIQGGHVAAGGAYDLGAIIVIDFPELDAFGKPTGRIIPLEVVVADRGGMVNDPGHLDLGFRYRNDATPDDIYSVEFTGPMRFTVYPEAGGGTMLWMRDRLLPRLGLSLSAQTYRKWAWLIENTATFIVSGATFGLAGYFLGGGSMETAMWATYLTAWPLFVFGHTSRAGRWFGSEAPSENLWYAKFIGGISLLLAIFYFLINLGLSSPAYFQAAPLLVPGLLGAASYVVHGIVNRAAGRARRNYESSLQKYIDLISEGDAITEAPDAFLVMGSPDPRTFIAFAGQWREFREKYRRDIPIVLAGGRGSGTVQLINNLIARYGNDSLTFLSGSAGGQGSVKVTLEDARTDERVKETDLLRYIFAKEGIPESAMRTESVPSKNTRENFENSLSAIEAAVGGNANPAVAIVITPPFLLRAGMTARRVWAEKGLDWQALRHRAFRADTRSLRDQELIDLGYFVGYPEFYVETSPRLNPHNELKGAREQFEALKALSGENAGWLEPMKSNLNRIDKPLARAQRDFARFLGEQEILEYDEAGRRLVINGFRPASGARVFDSVESLNRDAPEMILGILADHGLSVSEVEAALGLMEQVGSLYQNSLGSRILYHQHYHNLGVAYASLLLAVSNGFDNPRDLKVAFLAGLLHDFHLREPDPPASARVSETLLQLRDLLQVSAEARGPPAESKYSELVGPAEKSEFKKSVLAFLGGVNFTQAWNEIEAIIRRTDYPSDVKVPESSPDWNEFRGNAASTLFRRDVEGAALGLPGARTLNDTRADMGRLAREIESSDSGLSENQKTYARRVLSIELNYLNALSLSMRAERRKSVHRLAVMIEKAADQAGFYWLLSPRALETEIVPGLETEVGKDKANVIGTYPFFFVPVLLVPSVLDPLSRLPDVCKNNFLEVMSHFARLSADSELKIFGIADTVEDWKTRGEKVRSQFYAGGVNPDDSEPAMEPWARHFKTFADRIAPEAAALGSLVEEMEPLLLRQDAGDPDREAESDLARRISAKRDEIAALIEEASGDEASDSPELSDAKGSVRHYMNNAFGAFSFVMVDREGINEFRSALNLIRRELEAFREDAELLNQEHLTQASEKSKTHYYIFPYRLTVLPGGKTITGYSLTLAEALADQGVTDLSDAVVSVNGRPARRLQEFIRPGDQITVSVPKAISIPANQRAQQSVFRMGYPYKLAELLRRAEGRHSTMDAEALAEVNRLDHAFPGFAPDAVQDVKPESLSGILNGLSADDLRMVKDFSGNGSDRSAYDAIEPKDKISEESPPGLFEIFRDSALKRAVRNRLEGRVVDISRRDSAALIGMGDLTFNERLFLAHKVELQRLIEAANVRARQWVSRHPVANFFVRVFSLGIFTPYHDFDDALSRQKIILHIPNEQNGGSDGAKSKIVQEILDNHFFGFSPENIVFIFEESYPVYDFDAETWRSGKRNESLSPSGAEERDAKQGLAPFQEAAPGHAFTMEPVELDDGSIDYRQMILKEDALSYLEKLGGRIVSVENPNDLGMLEHPLKLDQDLAAEILFEKGFNYVGRAAEKIIGRKSGTMAQSVGQEFMVESPLIEHSAYNHLAGAPAASWGHRANLRVYREAIRRLKDPLFTVNARDGKLSLESSRSSITLSWVVRFRSVLLEGDHAGASPDAGSPAALASAIARQDQVLARTGAARTAVPGKLQPRVSRAGSIAVLLSGLVGLVLLAAGLFVGPASDLPTSTDSPINIAKTVRASNGSPTPTTNTDPAKLDRDLKSSDPDARAIALLNIVELRGDPDNSVADLLAAFQNDPDTAVRTIAAVQLLAVGLDSSLKQQLSDENLVAILDALLRSLLDAERKEPNDDLRDTVADILPLLGNDELYERYVALGLHPAARVPVMSRERNGSGEIVILFLDGFNDGNTHGAEVLETARGHIGAAEGRIKFETINAMRPGGRLRAMDQILSDLESSVAAHPGAAIIVNISLTDGALGLLTTEFPEEFIARMGAKGVVFVQAIGNRNDARFSALEPLPDNVLFVGAADGETRLKEAYSNFGPYADVFAVTGSNEGTSFAAPYAAAELALILDADKSISIPDAMRQLKEKAEPLAEDPYPGWLGAGYLPFNLKHVAAAFAVFMVLAHGIVQGAVFGIVPDYGFAASAGLWILGGLYGFVMIFGALVYLRYGVLGLAAALIGPGDARLDQPPFEDDFTREQIRKHLPDAKMEAVDRLPAGVFAQTRADDKSVQILKWLAVPWDEYEILRRWILPIVLAHEGERLRSAGPLSTFRIYALRPFRLFIPTLSSAISVSARLTIGRIQKPRSIGSRGAVVNPRSPQWKPRGTVGGLPSVLGEEYAKSAPYTEWIYQVPILNAYANSIMEFFAPQHRKRMKDPGDSRSIGVMTGGILLSSIVFLPAGATVIFAALWLLFSSNLFSLSHNGKNASERIYYFSAGLLFSVLTIVPPILFFDGTFFLDGFIGFMASVAMGLGLNVAAHKGLYELIARGIADAPYASVLRDESLSPLEKIREELAAAAPAGYDVNVAENASDNVARWGGGEAAQIAALLYQLPLESRRHYLQRFGGIRANSQLHKDIVDLTQRLSFILRIPYNPPYKSPRPRRRARDASQEYLRDLRKNIVQNQMDFVLQAAGSPDGLLLALAVKLEELNAASDADASFGGEIQRQVREIFAPLADRLGREDVSQELWSASLRRIIGETQYEKLLDLIGGQDTEEMESKITDWLRGRGIEPVMTKARTKQATSLIVKLARKGVSDEADITGAPVNDFINITVVFSDVASLESAFNPSNGVERALDPGGSQSWEREQSRHKGFDQYHIESNGIEIKLLTLDGFNQWKDGDDAHWAYKLKMDFRMFNTFDVEQEFISGPLLGDDYGRNFAAVLKSVKDRRLDLLFDSETGSILPVSGAVRVGSQFQRFAIPTAKPELELARGSNLDRLRALSDRFTESRATGVQSSVNGLIRLKITFDYDAPGLLHRVAKAILPVGDIVFYQESTVPSADGSPKIIMDVHVVYKDPAGESFTVPPSDIREMVAQIESIKTSMAGQVRSEQSIARRAKLKVIAGDRRGFLSDLTGVLLTLSEGININDFTISAGIQSDEEDGILMTKQLQALLNRFFTQTHLHEKVSGGGVMTFDLDIGLPEGVTLEQVEAQVGKLSDVGYVDAVEIDLDAPKERPLHFNLIHAAAAFAAWALVAAAGIVPAVLGFGFDAGSASDIAARSAAAIAGGAGILSAALYMKHGLLGLAARRLSVHAPAFERGIRIAEIDGKPTAVVKTDRLPRGVLAETNPDTGRVRILWWLVEPWSRYDALRRLLLPIVLAHEGERLKGRSTFALYLSKPFKTYFRLLFGSRSTSFDPAEIPDIQKLIDNRFPGLKGPDGSPLRKFFDERVRFTRIGRFFALAAPWRRAWTTDEEEGPRFRSVTQPRRPGDFHFGQVKDPSHIFWTGNLGGENVSLVQQAYPYERDHFLIVPGLENDLPQILRERDILLALNLVRKSSSPRFRIGFNSLASGASVNQLHLHAFNLPSNELSPLERSNRGRSYVLDGVRMSEIAGYPARGLFFESDDIGRLAGAAYSFVRFLQESNAAHVLMVTPRGIYVVPALNNKRTGFGNTWTFSEVMGYVIVSGQESIPSTLTEARVESELAGVTLDAENFNSVIGGWFYTLPSVPPREVMVFVNPYSGDERDRDFSHYDSAAAETVGRLRNAVSRIFHDMQTEDGLGNLPPALREQRGDDPFSGVYATISLISAANRSSRVSLENVAGGGPYFHFEIIREDLPKVAQWTEADIRQKMLDAWFSPGGGRQTLQRAPAPVSADLSAARPSASAAPRSVLSVIYHGIFAPLWEVMVFPTAGFMAAQQGFDSGDASLAAFGLLWATVGFVTAHALVRWIARRFASRPSDEYRARRIWTLAGLSAAFLVPFFIFSADTAAQVATGLHMLNNIAVLRGRLPEWWPLASTLTDDRPSDDDGWNNRPLPHAIPISVAPYVGDYHERDPYNFDPETRMRMDRVLETLGSSLKSIQSMYPADLDLEEELGPVRSALANAPDTMNKGKTFHVTVGLHSNKNQRTNMSWIRGGDRWSDYLEFHIIREELPQVAEWTEEDFIRMIIGSYLSSGSNTIPGRRTSGALAYYISVMSYRGRWYDLIKDRSDRIRKNYRNVMRRGNLRFIDQEVERLRADIDAIHASVYIRDIHWNELAERIDYDDETVLSPDDPNSPQASASEVSGRFEAGGERTRRLDAPFSLSLIDRAVAYMRNLVYEDIEGWDIPFWEDIPVSFRGRLRELAISNLVWTAEGLNAAAEAGEFVDMSHKIMIAREVVDRMDEALQAVNAADRAAVRDFYLALLLLHETTEITLREQLNAPWEDGPWATVNEEYAAFSMEVRLASAVDHDTWFQFGLFVDELDRIIREKDGLHMNFFVHYDALSDARENYMWRDYMLGRLYTVNHFIENVLKKLPGYEPVNDLDLASEHFNQNTVVSRLMLTLYGRFRNELMSEALAYTPSGPAARRRPQAKQIDIRMDGKFIDSPPLSSTIDSAGPLISTIQDVFMSLQAADPASRELRAELAPIRDILSGTFFHVRIFIDNSGPRTESRARLVSGDWPGADAIRRIDITLGTSDLVKRSGRMSEFVLTRAHVLDLILSAFSAGKLKVSDGLTRYLGLQPYRSDWNEIFLQMTDAVWNRAKIDGLDPESADFRELVADILVALKVNLEIMNASGYVPNVRWEDGAYRYGSSPYDPARPKDDEDNDSDHGNGIGPSDAPIRSASAISGRAALDHAEWLSRTFTGFPGAGSSGSWTGLDFDDQSRILEMFKKDVARILQVPFGSVSVDVLPSGDAAAISSLPPLSGWAGSDAIALSRSGGALRVVIGEALIMNLVSDDAAPRQAARLKIAGELDAFRRFDLPASGIALRLAPRLWLRSISAAGSNAALRFATAFPALKPRLSGILPSISRSRASAAALNKLSASEIRLAGVAELGRWLAERHRQETRVVSVLTVAEILALGSSAAALLASKSAGGERATVAVVTDRSRISVEDVEALLRARGIEGAIVLHQEIRGGQFNFEALRGDYASLFTGSTVWLFNGFNLWKGVGGNILQIVFRSLDDSTLSMVETLTGIEFSETDRAALRREFIEPSALVAKEAALREIRVISYQQ